MRAIAMICGVLLLSCSALAAEKPAERQEQKPPKVVSPKTDSAKPCSDVYRLAEASSADASKSLEESVREAMVRSSSPLGRALQQLSCLLAST
jgi:hypothetical protein